METYSEQEQVEKIKAWWQRNGTALMIGVTLGAAVVIGNNLWKNYKREEAEGASTLYQQMMRGYRAKQVEAAQAAGGELMEDYASTPYAGKAALYMARISFESGDSKSARAQLQWAIDQAAEPATVHAARLRLGRIMENAGELEQALALINVDDMGGFESEYQELRGDLLVAQGRIDQARPAYRRALDTLAAASTYGGFLQMKLDDLGEAESKK